MRRLIGDRLVIATHNKGKLREFGALLGLHVKNIVASGDLGLPEPEETGTTFAENAMLKARAAAQASRNIALADDSGLCVTALNGAPGVYSARWGGPAKDFDMAMRRVNDELGNAPDRSAYFACVLALAWPDQHAETAEGRVDGSIVWPPRGDQGHGYDPIFVPSGHHHTFAEMPPEEKDALSHRGRAARELIRKYLTRAAVMQDLAIYIHWPFCRSKCPYCDFNSHVANAVDHEDWRAAYRAEIGHYAREMPERRVTSIFFGGGTPSLMEAKTAATILQEIARHWAVAEDCEVTLEANPNSAEAGKFAGFREAGVNRLSLGVQSLRDEALKFLGRAHDASEARAAIGVAARHFPRSFDLIYARRDETLSAWEAELREALALADGHLSLYQLTIEPGTQFHTLNGRGEKLTAPADDAAAMYELTQDVLGAAGLPAYEVSNHAKPGAESRHNLAYWRYEDYIGIGPGAHGRFRGQGSAFSDQGFCIATEGHRAPDVWLGMVKEHGHGLRLREEIDRPTAQREALMMGLRLTAGIDCEAWRQKFGAPPGGESDAFPAPEKIGRLEREGYLAGDPRNLRATPAGLQRLDAVLRYLAD